MTEIIEPISGFEFSPTLRANEMVRERRAKGETVLQMGFGESPFPVPDRLQKMLKNASGHCQYLPTTGMPELCEAVKNYYIQYAGLPLDDHDVIIAPGSKLILYALQMAVKGDLLMPVPSWVSYEPQAKMLGHKVIRVPSELDDKGFHINPETLRRVIKNARTNRMNPGKIILNAPSNPTGLYIPESEMPELANVCKEENIFIISDEIYGFVSFDGHYRSITKYDPENTAISTGLSKHLSLGGWRIGVGFIPKKAKGLYNILRQIASETWSCVASPLQEAAICAHEGHKDIEQHISDCTAIHALMNRFIANKIRKAGIHCSLPQGAFYNYPNFEPFRESLAHIDVSTSDELANFLIQKYGLVALPGVAFGAENTDLTLRLSGCDYSGSDVLAAAQSGETLNDAFIEKNAPHIWAAANCFINLAEMLSSEKKKR